MKHINEINDWQETINEVVCCDCLELMKKIPDKGDLILDNCMGSWTTARACKDLGRNFIGCDLEEKYCRIGEERLKQQNLF